MTPKVLILNQGGMPQRWATWQDAVVLKAKGLVTWEMGEYDWTKYGGVSRMTGERSSINISSIMSVKGMHLPRRSVMPVTGPNLFRRDLKICAYCGEEFTENHLTIDHIEPKSLGGKHTWRNTVTACKKCNHHKGSRTLDELGWELLYVPYVPSPEEGLILKNRTILADQMDFIKKMLPKNSRLHDLEIH